MITSEQHEWINAQAYVPEHCVDLMTRVSGGEPFLFDDYFCCLTGDVLIVVGYPLGREFDSNALEMALNRMIQRFRPKRLSLAAPEVPSSLTNSCVEREIDQYYTLDLSSLTVPPGLRRTIAKAARNLRIEHGNALSEAHEELAREFVGLLNPPSRVKALLFKMWDYVGATEDSIVLSAWDRDEKLAAFYVVDFSTTLFSTYVIGCYSKKNYVSGASDFLASEMIRLSVDRGKNYIHLGLGVNPGIRRFKEKWGGVPSIKYEMCEIAVRKPSLLDSIVGYTVR
ncbi:MAG: hypothetical protein AB1473_07220 [Thermodesulfobacteriota bacterium]